MGRQVSCFLVFILVTFTSANGSIQHDFLDETIENLYTALNNFELKDIPFLRELPKTLSAVRTIAKAQVKLAIQRSDVTEGLTILLKRFNLRLGQVSQSFLDTAQLVDAKPTHFKIIGSMEVLKSMESKRQQLLTSGNVTDLDQIKNFDNEFDKAAVIVYDALYLAVYNEPGKGDQLFTVANKILHGHPRHVMEFARGFVELFLHAFHLEISHMIIIDAPKVAVHATVIEARKRFENVVDKIISVHKSLYANISSQIKEDQVRFHKQHVDMHHCDFAKMMRRYFEDKYPPLACFAQSYNPISTFNHHTISIFYLGGMYFREGGRNSVIDCRAKADLLNDFSVNGRNALKAIERKRKADKDFAKLLHNRVKRELDTRHLFPVSVTVVKADSRGCYDAPYGHTAISSFQTYKCKTKLCWTKKYYDFSVVLFG